MELIFLLGLLVDPDFKGHSFQPSVACWTAAVAAYFALAIALHVCCFLSGCY